MVEWKKFKNWEEEVLKQGKISSQTQIKSFERYIQDVLNVLIKNTQSEIKEVHKIYSERGFKKFLWWNARNSRIGKKMFIESDKKFLKIYSRCSEGVNKKDPK